MKGIKMIRFLGLFLSLTFLVTLNASAQLHIAVDTVQRYFMEGGKRFQTLKVRNNHPTDTFEVGSNLVLYTNIRDRDRKEAEFEPVQGHFMLAPKKFVLKPGQVRSVRLVRTKEHEEEERVYRLSFSPREMEQDKNLNNENAMGVKPSTRVVTAAGMLVLVSPKSPNLNIEYTRDEEGIVFTNTGNIAADFRLTKEYCYTSDEGSDCMQLPGKRIYPNNTWRFDVSPEIPIRWSVTGYKELQQWLNIPELD